MRKSKGFYALINKKPVFIHKVIHIGQGEYPPKFLTKLKKEIGKLYTYQPELLLVRLV
jgi:hypothetical protein